MARNSARRLAAGYDADARGRVFEEVEVSNSSCGNLFSMRVKGYERYSFTDYDYWKQAVYKQPVRTTGGGRASSTISAGRNALKPSTPPNSMRPSRQRR